MARDNEITSQICRNELLGLLNTMTPFEQQRITAEIVAPVVDVAEVAADEPVVNESSRFSIRFAAPAAAAPTPAPAPATPMTSAEPQQRMSSLAIALTSFGVTLAIGALVIMAA
jgi:hypothetical protein